MSEKVFEDSNIHILSYFNMKIHNTAKNNVISPNLLVWKFCGKHSFHIVSGDSSKIIKNGAFHKISHEEISWHYGILPSVTLQIEVK